MLSVRCLSVLSCPVCLSVLPVTLYYGQTVGWIKKKLGTEVGLGPGHIVLDGDPASLSPRGTASIFGPCLLWPNGWLDQDATWYGGRSRTRRYYVRWGHISSHKTGEAALPSLFGPCIVAKRLDGSDATWYGARPRPRPFRSGQHCVRCGPSFTSHAAQCWMGTQLSPLKGA